MKALKVVLLSLGLMFAVGNYALAGQCDGKLAKACLKMKTCRWDKVSKSCKAKGAAAKKGPAAAKKAPPPVEEPAPNADVGDEGETGDDEGGEE